MSAAEDFDLIIIGSGSGNTLLDERWAEQRVAMIDGGTFGGTCINVGCIPTKMFAYPAETAREALELDRLGVRMAREAVDWPGMRDRIFGRIDPISEGGLEYRRSQENVTVFTENCRFIDQHTVRTDSGRELRGAQIVIAAGARAVLPDIPGIDLPGVHTSDTVMRLERLPQRIVILGGGFIAAEFASIFSGLGAQVIQCNRSQRLLREHDELIAERFTEAARRQWDLRLGTTISSLREREGGGLEVVLQSTEHAGDLPEESIEADVVLLATGRVSNADRLGAAEVGFDVAEGILQVDPEQRVLSQGQPVEGIFALGDVCSRIQLKHFANAQARTVAHNLLADPEDLRRTDSRYVPAAVFASPQIAAVGLTEEQAREQARRKGQEITVSVQEMGDVAYGWAMEDVQGAVKLIACRDTGHLLGAQVIGHDAATLIQPLVQAMSFGLDAHSMARGQYWIHPALTEAVENALLGLETADS